MVERPSNMAERVGSLHIHELPHNRELPIRTDVYKCYCGKEFMVEENKESGFNKSPKKWVEVSGDLYVEYEKTVNGERFIGRAGPDTVFDEVNDERVAEGNGTEVPSSSDGAGGTSSAV